MKVTRALLGKEIRLEWRDPVGHSRAPIDQAPKGYAALAVWRERGIIDDITDGVVRVVHSEGRNPGATETDEISYTVVPEELIITLVVLVEEGGKHEAV